MNAPILVVDDEQDFLDSMMRLLLIRGFKDITTVSRPSKVAGLLESGKQYAVALLDLTMPEMDGIDVLDVIKEHSPGTECIMITANESVPLVVKAMRHGAYDYLLKPLLPDQVTMTLERALERRTLVQSLRLRSGGPVYDTLSNPDAFQPIATSDDAMVRLLHEAELHAGSTIPILVTGETGVGKELLARAIHDASRRARGPFVPVNMLALSLTLFESEFFGHVRGAFTGATSDKDGYLAKARGGTLFLDEIGDLSMELQGKLLRILQEGEYVRVGATHAQTADVRFVAATNQNLEALVEQKLFRMDLFYRLQFAHLRIPPLRERLGDVPELCNRILAGAERPCEGISAEALAMLSRYAWPGNVRQLEGALHAAANLAEGGVIEPRHLRMHGAVEPEGTPGDASSGPGDVGVEPLADVERRHILAVYDKLEHNKAQTARALQIGLQTLHRRLKDYGVK